MEKVIENPMEKIAENQAGKKASEIEKTVGTFAEPSDCTNNTIDLHRQFRTLAFDVHKMKNRLMMLLLEIYEQEIYKKHNCTTIYEYAFKYAKLSKETVQLALRTLKNTEDKPLLRAQIESKGIYKVAMVAKLATPETEKFYADHVQKMPKPILFEFAKEVRKSGKIENEEVAESAAKFEVKCWAVVPKVTIELDEEMQIIFNQLKKDYGKDLSNKEALRMILKKVEQKDVPGNASLSKTSFANTTPQTFKVANPSDAPLPAQPPKFPSHTIPRDKKREIDIKQNHKCAYPNCVKPIENYHHKVPFSFSRSHASLVGLCEVHHEFCHHGIIRHELDEPNQWRLNIKPARSQFDNFFLKYKGAANN
ncbi:hypothetical protein HY604_03540 [Candidatus Peregrinibacteria bacterium]|nr:hypothetical protein [Candidatus Peregrinibacteria bacterium]